jgi:mono/diheme cytochrome c family protein
MSSELTIWFGGMVLLSVACGAAQTNASKVDLPAEVGELPANLEDDYRVFAINCSKCHGLERPLAAPVTDRGHWERYVTRMMRTPGSGISAQEAPNILAFLYWYTDKRSGKHSGPQATAPIVEAPVDNAPAQAAEPTPAIAPQGEGAP